MRRRRIVMKLRHSCNTHNRFSPSAVSVHTLQPLIYTSSSPSLLFLPVSGWWWQLNSSRSFLAMWWVRTFVRSFGKSCFYTVERLRTFGVSNPILRYTRTQVFETHRTETVAEKQGRMGSLRFCEHTACTTARHWSPSFLPHPSQSPLYSSKNTFWAAGDVTQQTGKNLRILLLPPTTWRWQLSSSETVVALYLTTRRHMHEYHVSHNRENVSHFNILCPICC